MFPGRESQRLLSEANAAIGAEGAIAVVLSNDKGSINMDLTDYQYTQPCVSVTQRMAP